MVIEILSRSELKIIFDFEDLLDLEIYSIDIIAKKSKKFINLIGALIDNEVYYQSCVPLLVGVTHGNTIEDGC